MNSPDENLSYYERISWIIICETIALSIFISLNLNGNPDSPFYQLMIAVMIYVQLPAVNFISDYLSRRADKIKKFFVSLAITSTVVIAIGILGYALRYQTLPTLVALVLFGISMWLNFFPPPWFKEIIKKFKKKE